MADTQTTKALNRSARDLNPNSDVRLRQRAIARVHMAVVKGILSKLDGKIACTDCGKPAWQYDHRDYGKPLEVQPVCHKCNNHRGPARNWIPPSVALKRSRATLQNAVEFALRVIRAITPRNGDLSDEIRMLREVLNERMDPIPKRKATERTTMRDISRLAANMRANKAAFEREHELRLRKAGEFALPILEQSDVRLSADCLRAISKLKQALEFGPTPAAPAPSPR